MAKKRAGDTVEAPPLAEMPPQNGVAPPVEAPDSGDKRLPVFRIGPIATDRNGSVSAAVWENEVNLPDGRTFKVHNVSVEARYREESGEWKSCKSFRGSQLYAVIYCLQRASDFILASRDPRNDCPF